MPGPGPQTFAAKVGVRSCFAVLWAVSSAGGCLAQALLMGPGGAPNLLGTDLAVFEAREPRKDLPCTVVPQKAVLGFDLKFHAGYEVSVPLKELAGMENQLITVFRVSEASKPDFPVYFVQRINVPNIEEDARGDAVLQGSFDLGEGKFQVDWLMRDRSDRVCSTFWESEASLSPKDKGVVVALETGEIAPTDQEQFEPEPFLRKAEGVNGLNLKVLINFAPQNAKSATLQQLPLA